MQANISQVENVIDLNATALAQGDAYLADSKFSEALTCYRAVRTKDEVIAIEKDRIEALQDRLRGIQTAMRADPKNAGQFLLVGHQVQDSIAEDQKLLEEYTKLPSIRSKLLYRMGRAFAGANDTWKSIVAYTDAYEITEDPADREPSLFALITSYADVNQAKDARAACDQYFKEFPKGANALDRGLPVRSDGVAGKRRAGGGRLLRAGARRAARQHPARGDHLPAGQRAVRPEQVRRGGGDLPQVPQPSFRTACISRNATFTGMALCSLFNGKYEEATKRINDFLKKYPEGESVARRGVPARGVRQRRPGLQEGRSPECQDWLKKYPGDQQQGEVLALLGDAYGALDQPDEAFDAYQRSYKAATTDEVLNYSLFAAAKIPQKRNEWDKVDAMFEEFIKDHPDRPEVVQAAYWIGAPRPSSASPKRPSNTSPGWSGSLSTTRTATPSNSCSTNWRRCA